MWIQGRDGHGNFAYKPATAVGGVFLTMGFVLMCITQFWPLVIVAILLALGIYYRSGKTPAQKFRDRFAEEDTRK